MHGFSLQIDISFNNMKVLFCYVSALLAVALTIGIDSTLCHPGVGLCNNIVL